MARQLINVLTERVFFLAEMREFIAGKPTAGTIHSWATFGRRNVYTGKTVRLETIRLPNGLCTSLEAYERFVKALNDTGEDDEKEASDEPAKEISEKCS